jgi:hypothetical protein
VSTDADIATTLREALRRDLDALQILSVTRYPMNMWSPKWEDLVISLRDLVEQIDQAWELAADTLGKPGERARWALVTAYAVVDQHAHETLPGAPPTPEWVARLTHRVRRASHPGATVTSLIGDARRWARRLGQKLEHAYESAVSGLETVAVVGLGVVLGGGAIYLTGRK